MPVESHQRPASEPQAQGPAPEFQQRWDAWLARGRQADIANRAQLRVAAMAVVVIAAAAFFAMRLSGGGL